jgi:Helicase HerA, central domain
MLEHLPIGTQDEKWYQEDNPIFTISPDTRRKHVAIFGATGAGKSTLLRNMIAWDISAGAGVTVVDPHGQLVDDILNHHLPSTRTGDVIYFNPKDLNRAIPLNLLDSPAPEFDGLVVDNVLGIFKQLWPDAFAAGARMEDIFRNSFYALIEHPSPTSLWNLPRFLTDAAYRAVIMRKVRNPAVRTFFEKTFNAWTPQFREEAISPVLNKTRPFLTDPRIRAVIGPAIATFRFRSVIDGRKIFLCDLSKGAIGSDNARLLGSLIVMQHKLAALSRYDLAEADRVPHPLYVEEAQNFIGDFESIFAETRKYGLPLTIATQGIESLSRDDASAVFTNCGTVISFRVSGADALRLNQEFGMELAAANLQDLPDFAFYVRTLKPLMRARGPSASPTAPHLVTAYPPFGAPQRQASRESVVRTSIERWTRPRAELETKLARFLKREFRGNKKTAG